MSTTEPAPVPVVAETSTVVAPTEPPAPTKSFSKKNIFLLLGVFVLLFVLFTFNKRINTVQKRNNEILKMLKGAEEKHRATVN